MAKYSVTAESPVKVKTIKKSLGANCDVDASNEYMRDLPRSQFGVDVEHDYESRYVTMRGKGDTLVRLQKEMRKADVIYLATDPDREREAISRHLVKALKLDEAKDKKVYRISFNETTRNAVKTSLKASREIGMDLVDARQARRILDCMVSYTISSLLWAKVEGDLNANRVQSVAPRMIRDRESEIDAFIPGGYQNLGTDLLAQGSEKPLVAKSCGDKNDKMTIHSKEELDTISKKLKNKEYVVEEVKNGGRVRKTPIPFATGTPQQEASKVLNFSTQKIMRLAQQLYEGVEVKGYGTVGLITYLRTDSTRIAEEIDVAARTYADEQYDGQYVAWEEAVKEANGKIQDAHKAIRPTDITLTPAMVKESLRRGSSRLYQLIWKRFTASRMQPAVYDAVSVEVSAGEYSFTLAASKLSFDDFMSIYVQEEDKEDSNMLLSKLEKGAELKFSKLKHNQHLTQPSTHFMEASLVEAMEEQGIE